MKQNTTAVKPKRFFYHYNKPASKTQGKNVITIHWEGACNLVNKIKTIGIDVESHDQKRQPRCIMRGYATEVLFKTDTDGKIVGIIK